MKDDVGKKNYLKLINGLIQVDDLKSAEVFAINFLVNFPTEIPEFLYHMAKIYSDQDDELNEKELLKALGKGIKHFIHDPYILSELAIELDERFGEKSSKINRFIEDALLKKADPEYKDRKANEYAYHLLNFYRQTNPHQLDELISICICSADAYPENDDIMEFISEIAEDLGIENYLENSFRVLQRRHPNAKALSDFLSYFKAL